MKIAIASPTYPASIEDALAQIDRYAGQAADAGAVIVCFPESYVPGYPLDLGSWPRPAASRLAAALASAQQIAARRRIALILPMDWWEGGRFLNVAMVIDAHGRLLGMQIKNQLDPSEDARWEPGTARQIFDTGGLRFGIVISHEGFRYPETVRWAARNGAQVVFHPHFNGSDTQGPGNTEWFHPSNPYYEKAFMMRALENTVYFASSNCATRYPESASAIMAPDGSCLVHAEYGRPGLIIADIEPARATGYLAARYKPGSLDMQR